MTDTLDPSTAPLTASEKIILDRLAASKDAVPIADLMDGVSDKDESFRAMISKMRRKGYDIKTVGRAAETAFLLEGDRRQAKKAPVTPPNAGRGTGEPEGPISVSPTEQTLLRRMVEAKGPVPRADLMKGVTESENSLKVIISKLRGKGFTILCPTGKGSTAEYSLDAASLKRARALI